MPILISVVTVARNSGKTIADTCVSISKQTWPHVEHILIDGASSDDTVAAARVSARPGMRILSEPDQGIYDAMNKGFRMAHGEVIGCLNADDMLAHPRVLERIAEVFADPGVDVCYADLVYVDPVHTERVIRYWHSGAVSEGDFRLGLMPAHPTFYFRRDVLNKVGYFDLSLGSANDFEMTLRCLQVFKLRAVYLPEVLVKMRAGGFSNRSLKGVIRQNRDIIEALHMHGMKPSWFYPFGKMIVKLRQYFLRPKK